MVSVCRFAGLPAAHHNVRDRCVVPLCGADPVAHHNVKDRCVVPLCGVEPCLFRQGGVGRLGTLILKIDV